MSDTPTRHATTGAIVATALDKAADLIDPGINNRLTRQAGILFPGFDVNEPSPSDPTALPTHIREAVDELIASFNALPVERRPKIRQVIGRATQTPPVDPGDSAALAARQAHNQQLSSLRAGAVFQALKNGLPAETMNDVTVSPYGEFVPWLDFPDTEHVLNRSVEVVWEQPSPPSIEIPATPPTDWGTLQIETSYTVNAAGIFLFARNVAKEGLKSLMTFEWAGKALKKIDVIDLKGGASVGSGQLTHAGETRTIGVLHGVAAIGIKPPSPDVFDLLNLLEAEFNPTSDTVEAFQSDLTLDDLDGATFLAVTGNTGGLFVGGELGALLFLSTDDNMRPLAIAYLSGPSVSNNFVPSLGITFKSGVIKVYDDDTSRNAFQVMTDMASEPVKYLFRWERIVLPVLLASG